MKKFLFPLCLLISLNAYVQKSTTSSKHILVRGKASSFFLVEDAFWRNANIGAEFRFLNKHSIGIDFVYFRWRYQNDSIVNDIEYSTGYNCYSLRKYLLIDYRYYPFPNIKHDYDIDIYFNPFIKIGKRSIWSEDPYTFVATSDMRQTNTMSANFDDYGFAIGFRYCFDMYDRFGIDVNMGIVKRHNDIWYEKGYDYTSNSFFETHNTTSSSTNIHMRVNFFLKVFQY